MTRIYAHVPGLLVLLLGIAALLAGCGVTPAARPQQQAAQPDPSLAATAEAELLTEEAADPLVEHPVVTIPLTGSLALPEAELSGLAWYNDYLVLLPQYPNFATDYQGEGVLYLLPKAEILAYLDGTTSGPLQPQTLPFVAPGLAEAVAGFEGYEAIVFADDQAYLTIEAAPGEPDAAGTSGMRGYLARGVMRPDLGGLVIETTSLERLAELAPQSASANKSDEAILVENDRVVTIHEVNGDGLNPSPQAHVFDLALTPQSPIPFPNVEYRMTDASQPGFGEFFWAINSFFPGDEDLLPSFDPLTELHGAGPTHRQFAHVERLVEFRYVDVGIVRTSRPPVQLELTEEPRNWEGLVRLDDRGFLLATDTFPRTILGFVAVPSLADERTREGPTGDPEEILTQEENGNE